MSEHYLVTTANSYPRILVWLVGVSFVLLQFSLQLSSGVVISSIMREFNLSATLAGIIGSAFYFVYTTLQIPAGFLFDKKNPRTILAITALICSLGCFIFSHAHSIEMLMIGRLFIGFGSAFAFVGLCYLLRINFPKSQFAFMIGFSETLGFLVASFAIVSFGNYIDHFGWRFFIDAAVIMAGIIALCSWIFISDTSSCSGDPSRARDDRGLIDVFRNGKLWINGLFVGLSFTIVTVFAAFWLAPFVQIKLHATMQQASQMTAIFFVGAAISCPLFGILANRVKHRRLLTLVSCLSTAFLTLTFILYPTSNIIFLTSLLFLAGIACGTYMLAYTISNEIAPKHLLSTATGFTNTLAMLTAPILQPFVGFIIDSLLSQQTPLYSYQIGLTIIPIAIIIAGILSTLLPENKTD